MESKKQTQKYLVDTLKKNRKAIAWKLKMQDLFLAESPLDIEWENQVPAVRFLKILYLQNIHSFSTSPQVPKQNLEKTTWSQWLEKNKDFPSKTSDLGRKVQSSNFHSTLSKTTLPETNSNRVSAGKPTVKGNLLTIPKITGSWLVSGRVFPFHSGYQWSYIPISRVITPVTHLLRPFMGFDYPHL